MKVAIQVDRQDGSLEPLKEEQQNGPLKVKDGNLLESWGSHVDVPYHWSPISTGIAVGV